MTAGGLVGKVGELWRFPVKSMLGERLADADVSIDGLVGDRAYGIVDAATGRVASAKHPRLWPDLFRCRATFLEPPQAGSAPPPARIELGDGTMVHTDAGDIDDRLSRYLGRPVRLTSVAPPDYTISEYRPDIEHLNPAGDRDVVVEQRLGAAFFGALGLPSVVRDESLVDLFPLSVLTTSSLCHFTALSPDSEWDTRRFRMNVIIETPSGGLPENNWVGGPLRIGDGTTLVAALPTPRCVMTTLAQEELARDSRILKAIATHNRLDVAGTGSYPCLGIYALITQPGPLHVGDQVRLIPAAGSVGS